MPNRLLVVTGAFAVRGNAVELLPAVGSEQLPASPFDLTLRLPSGVQRQATGTAVVAHTRGALPPKAMVRLHDVTAEDVPPGTEVWSK
jgi:uncharacterized lipoprotein YbaY